MRDSNFLPELLSKWHLKKYGDLGMETKQGCLSFYSGYLIEPRSMHYRALLNSNCSFLPRTIVYTAIIRGGEQVRMINEPNRTKLNE